MRLAHVPASYATLISGLVCVTGLLVSPAGRADDSTSIGHFRDAIVALAPDVDPGEAEAVSLTSHNTARRLAREWRVVPFAPVQNFLIHIGMRERGYCFHWAYGIGAELKKLRLKTLVLHWGAAHAGTRLEHNVIVVTARGQPFAEGYIIDGWRAAGRLLWYPVSKDEYPWKEDPQETAALQNHGPGEQETKAMAEHSLPLGKPRGGR